MISRSETSPFLAPHRPLHIALDCIKPAIILGMAAVFAGILLAVLLAQEDQLIALDAVFKILSGYFMLTFICSAIYIWYVEEAFTHAAAWVHRNYGLHLSRQEIFLLLETWYGNTGEPVANGYDYGTVVHGQLILQLIDREGRCLLLQLNAPEGAKELPYCQHVCDAEG